MNNSNQKKQLLYRYYNKDDELLYVGVTADNTKRESQHRRDSFWFGEIAFARYEYFDTREEVLEAEAKAIASEQPKHNVKGTHRDTSTIRIDFHPKLHLVQLMNYEGWHDDVHANWIDEIKSWIKPHECWDLKFDDHLAWHLHEYKTAIDDDRRFKLAAHWHCDKCKEIFDTDWYLQHSERALKLISGELSYEH